MTASAGAASFEAAAGAWAAGFDFRATSLMNTTRTRPSSANGAA